MQMYVYLIHFKHKLHHAGHYIGFSKCLDFRIACHREGSGAKLIRAINRLGIPWIVVRTWKVDGQGFERWLKNQKHASRFCPVCNPNLTHIENAYRGGDDFREAFAIELNHMTERIISSEHALPNSYPR